LTWCQNKQRRQQFLKRGGSGGNAAPLPDLNREMTAINSATAIKYISLANALRQETNENHHHPVIDLSDVYLVLSLFDGITNERAKPLNYSNN
jgi:hypothetical protein